MPGSGGLKEFVLPLSGQRVRGLLTFQHSQVVMSLGSARDHITGRGGAGGFGGGGLRGALSSAASWWSANVVGNKALRARLSTLFKGGQKWGQWGYTQARHIGWFLVTTAMITAVPLIFEYSRESQLEEMENLQVAKSLAEGANPLALKEQGFNSAIDPPVLR